MRQQTVTQPQRRTLLTTFASVAISWFGASAALAEDAPHPKYKPSSRSPVAVDILSNAYGGSRSAPNAMQISDVVTDFVLASAGGGQVSLEKLRATGPVVLIFYRGHW